jgi:uncharacterized membrane protein YgcG
MQDYAASSKATFHRVATGTQQQLHQQHLLHNNQQNVLHNNNKPTGSSPSGSSSSSPSSLLSSLSSLSSHRAFVYGQIVQLIHVQTGKFLHGSASAATSAGAVTSAYALLDSGGDAKCYWKLGIPLAMRTVRRVGDHVQSGDEVLLEHAASGMFMHASPFVTSDDGEPRALLSASPDSTFVVRRSGRAQVQRFVASRDAVRLMRRDGRYLVACAQSRSVWFMRVHDSEGAPESAAAIWVADSAAPLVYDAPCALRLFGTQLLLAHSGANDAPLTLIDADAAAADRAAVLFTLGAERRRHAAARTIAFEAPCHLRHAATQHAVRCADIDSELSDVQLDDAFATSELFLADTKQQSVWRALASPRRASADHVCMVQSVGDADLRRHAVVHRAAVAFARYIKKLRHVNGAVDRIAESVTDAAADAVELLSAHILQQASFVAGDGTSGGAELDGRTASLLFASAPDVDGAGRFVVSATASSFQLRAALTPHRLHQDAVGTAALIEQLIDMLTLPFPNRNLADFGKRVLMFEFDEVQRVMRLVYELLALLVRDNARTASMLVPHVGMMLQQLGCSLGVAGVVRSVMLQTTCSLCAADVDAVLALMQARRDARHIEVLSAAVRSDEHATNANRTLVERALFGARWRVLLPAFELRDGVVFVRDDAKLDWMRLSTMSRARGIQPRVDALVAMLRLFETLCAPRASSCSARVSLLLPMPLMLAAVRDDQATASMRAALVAAARALYVDASPNRSVLSLASLHALCPHVDDPRELLGVAAACHVYDVEPGTADTYDELLLAPKQHETRDSILVLRERFNEPSSFAEFALMIVCDEDQLRLAMAEADDLRLFAENVRLLHDCVRTGWLRTHRRLLVLHLLPRLFDILELPEAQLLKEDDETSGRDINGQPVKVVLSRRAESVTQPPHPLVALLCDIKLEATRLLELLHALESHHALFFAVRDWREASGGAGAAAASSNAESVDVELTAAESRRDVSLRVMKGACEKDWCSKSRFIDELHRTVDEAALADAGSAHIVQRRSHIVSDLLAHSWTPLTVAAMRLLEEQQVTRSPAFAAARLAAVLQMTSGAAQARLYVAVTRQMKALERALPLVCECAVLDAVGAAHKAALKQCREILQALSLLCRRDGGGAAQRMLAAVNAHVEALLLVRLAVEAPDAAQLDAVGEAALRFLASFALKCAPNQALLQPYINYLLSAMSQRPTLSRMFAHVMHETFHGNRALCAALSMRTIEAFVALLERTNDTAYLNFLSQIMAPDRRPVLQTQRRVLFALSKSNTPSLARLLAAINPDDAAARCAALIAQLEATPMNPLQAAALRASSSARDAADDADDDVAAAPHKRKPKKSKSKKSKRAPALADSPMTLPSDHCGGLASNPQPSDSIEYAIAVLETIARACERHPANARRARLLLSDKFLIDLMSRVSHLLVPSDEGEQHALAVSGIGDGVSPRANAAAAANAGRLASPPPPLLALPLAHALVRALNVVWLAPLATSADVAGDGSAGAGHNCDAWFSSAALWRALANFASVTRRRARLRMKSVGAAIQVADVTLDSGDERADEFVFDGLVPFVAGLFASVYVGSAASTQQRDIALELGRAVLNLSFTTIDDAARLLALAEALRSLYNAGVMTSPQAKKMYQEHTDHAANIRASSAPVPNRTLTVVPLRGERWQRLNTAVFGNIVAAFGASIEVLDRLSALRFYVSAASGLLRHWTPTSLAVSCLRCLYAHARHVLQCDIDDSGAVVPLAMPVGVVAVPPPLPTPRKRTQSFSASRAGGVGLGSMSGSGGGGSSGGVGTAGSGGGGGWLSGSGMSAAVAARLAGSAQQDWLRRRRWLAFQQRFPRGPLALMAFMSFARRDCAALFAEGARLAVLLLATDVDGAVSETIMQWFYARSDEPFFADAFAVLRSDNVRLRTALGDELDAQKLARIVGDAVVSGGAMSLEDEVALSDDSNEHARQDGAHFYRDPDESVMRLFSIMERLCIGSRAQAYKNYMRSQGDNYRSYDLVSESARYLKHLGRAVAAHVRLTTRVVVALDALVSECSLNREIVLRSKIWSVVNEVLQTDVDALAGDKVRDFLDLQLAMTQLLLTLLDSDNGGDAAHQLLLRLEPAALSAQTSVLQLISGRAYARVALRGYTTKKSEASVVMPSDVRERRIRLASRALQCVSTLVERAESHAIVSADDSAAATAAVVVASMSASDDLGGGGGGGGGSGGVADSAEGGADGADFLGAVTAKYRDALEDMSQQCAQRIGSVEVVLASGRLERVYFPVPLECQAVHGGAEQALMSSLIEFMVARNINWSNPTDLVAVYVQWCEEQLVRLDTAASLLRHSRWRRLIAGRRKWWLDLSGLLSIAINLMLLSYSNGTFLNDYPLSADDSPRGGQVALVVVGVLHVVTSLLLTLSFYFRLGPFTNYRRFRRVYAAPVSDKQSSYLFAFEASRAPYLQAVTNSSRGRFLLRSVWHYVTDWESIFHITYLLFSVLGLTVSSFLYVSHLFQIVVRFDQLKTIVRAIYNIATRLLLTILLAIVCIYTLAVLAFLTLRGYFDEAGGIVCTTLFRCFLSSIHYGVQLLGGLVQVEVNPPEWESEGFATALVLYQMLFFIVVGVFLINILLALIVDEFGNLRSQRQVANTERFTRCLVCSIERETFQRNGVDFGHHIRVEHNIVHYLYLFAHLKYTSVLEFGATERYIYERTLEEAYLKFFPTGRAMALDHLLGEKRAAAEEVESPSARTNQAPPDASDDEDDDDDDGDGEGGDGGDEADGDIDVDKAAAAAASEAPRNSRVEELLEQLLVRLAALETAVAATGARVEKRVEVETPASPESAASATPATVVEAPTSTPAESSTTPVTDAQEAPEAKADEETNSEDMIAELLASRAVSKNPYLDDSDDD